MKKEYYIKPAIQTEVLESDKVAFMTGSLDGTGEMGEGRINTRRGKWGDLWCDEPEVTIEED